MTTFYIIERRYADGRLDLSHVQPEDIFGDGAIHGMTSDAIAKIVHRHYPDAVLRGDNIAAWPSSIHPQFRARVKTW